MTKRTIVYARVSTDDQAERGYSLPSQIEACQRYAAAHGFEVVGVYQDDISGTTHITNRPGGEQVQAGIDARATDVVIVYQVDRLFRDTVELLITVRQWLRSGIELHFCDIGKVKSENDILLVIRGWAGSDEREKIAERMKRGKNSKARKGLVVSNAPYGYDFNEGILTPNADAEIVKLIFTWYVLGDGESGPLTLKGIELKLEAMGIPAPGLKKNYRRRRPNNTWNIASIRQLLKRKTYIGTATWGETRMRDGKRDWNSTEEMIEIAVPAIISQEFYDAAQVRLEYNRKMARRNCRRNYLLRGRAKCRCGFMMTGYKSKYGGRAVYRCPSNAHIIKNAAGEKCSRKPIACEDLEPIAWNYALEIVTDKEGLELKLRAAQQQELDTLQPKIQRLEAVKALLANCESEALRLALTLRQDPGGIVGDMLKHQVTQVNAQHASLSNESATLEDEIEHGALSDVQIAMMLNLFTDDFFAGIDNATQEDKERVIEVLDVRVEITDDDKARVSCRLRVPEREFELTQS